MCRSAGLPGPLENVTVGVVARSLLRVVVKAWRAADKNVSLYNEDVQEEIYICIYIFTCCAIFAYILRLTNVTFPLLLQQRDTGNIVSGFFLQK